MQRICSHFSRWIVSSWLLSLCSTQSTQATMGLHHIQSPNDCVRMELLWIDQKGYGFLLHVSESTCTQDVGRNCLEQGADENISFAYHGFHGLIEMLHCKNCQIKFHRLWGLNQARKLLLRTTALSDQKRLLMVVASGKVAHVDRLVAIGLAQKREFEASLRRI